MANSTNLDVQMLDPFSLAIDSNWPQIDVDVDFDMYLQGDIGMDDSVMADLSMNYPSNNNQIIDPNLLDSQFLNILKEPQADDMIPGRPDMDQREIFNQGDCFPFPPQERVSSRTEQPAISSRDISQPQTKSKAASAKSEQDRETIPVPQKVKRKRISKKKKRTPQEEELKRQKFLGRNRVAAAKCREKKKEQTENLQGTCETVLREHSALKAELQDLQNELELYRAIIAAHDKVPGHCQPTMVVTDVSRQASSKLIAECLAQGCHTDRLSSGNCIVTAQRPNGIQTLPTQHFPQMNTRQISGHQEYSELSRQKSYHTSHQSFYIPPHAPVPQHNTTVHQYSGMRSNGMCAPAMQQSHSWPGINAGQRPYTPRYYHHQGPPPPEGIIGGFVQYTNPHLPFYPVGGNGGFNPHFQSQRSVSQGGWNSNISRPPSGPMTRPFSAPPNQFTNRLNFVYENPANIMQRDKSGDSHASGESSRHDSGVSNMGSPPEKSKAQTPPKDEGFEGSVHDIKKIVAPAPQAHQWSMMLRPQFRGHHPPMIPNLQDLGGSVTATAQHHIQHGLSDLTDPSIWLNRNASRDGS